MPAASRVYVGGDLDNVVVAQSGRTLSERHGNAGTVVVDLSEVEFVDRSGIRAILAAGERARRSDGRQVVVLRDALLDRVGPLTGVSRCVRLIDGDRDESDPARAARVAGDR